MTYFTVLPARGGSKNFPNKNTALLSRDPLIHDTFAAVLQAQNIDRGIACTKDPEILRTGQDLNVEVHVRPYHLATDVSLLMQFRSSEFQNRRLIVGVKTMGVYAQPNPVNRKTYWKTMAG